MKYNKDFKCIIELIGKEKKFKIKNRKIVELRIWR